MDNHEVKRAKQSCTFVSIDGKKCGDSAHPCGEFNGKYVGLCVRHYTEVNNYQHMFYEEVTSGQTSPRCHIGSDEYIGAMFQPTPKCDVVPCLYCPTCYNKYRDGDEPSTETIKNYAYRLKQLQLQEFFGL